MDDDLEMKSQFSASSSQSYNANSQGVKLNMTVKEVCDWLCFTVKLPQYADSFLENKIDGARLSQLTSKELINKATGLSKVA